MRDRSVYTGVTKIITFAGNKGGIGKTTCSINFAVECAMHGHEVTLIDLDRQASAARWGDLRLEYAGPARVLFNRVPHHSLYLVDEGNESVKYYEIEALPCYVVDRIAFAHAYNNGESVGEYEPRGKAAAEIRALYACITKELKELGGIHE